MKAEHIVAYALGRQSIARTFFTVFLVLAFLGAQQNAAPHALTHLNEVDASSQQQTDADKKAPSSVSHCAQCLAFSALGGVLPSTAPMFITALFVEQTPENVAHDPRLATRTSAFAARAPPTLS